jgi:hypothetical protein
VLTKDLEMPMARAMKKIRMGNWEKAESISTSAWVQLISTLLK